MVGDLSMRHLILKFDGVMQAWGGHTYEDFRPSELFPTRSGIIGLLAACLGIERNDSDRLQSLANSVKLTVRAEPRSEQANITRIIDYHTVKNARTVKELQMGSVSKNSSTIVSHRQYLCDSIFTVAIGEVEHAKFNLADIAVAVKKPIYTPFLGRRSCPLSRPLFESWIDAADGLEALRQYGGTEGVVYSEDESDKGVLLRIRDVPMYGRVRQFGTRIIYVHAGG